jgi:hypothetical protein
MKKTQLAQMQREAQRHNPNATVIHTKKAGYFLVVDEQSHALGTDSVHALFRLEKLLLTKS